MRATADGKTSGWTNDYNGLRTYCASDSPPPLCPSRASSAISDNRDIHAADTPDMVIITPPAPRPEQPHSRHPHRRS